MALFIDEYSKKIFGLIKKAYVYSSRIYFNNVYFGPKLRF